MAQMAHDGLARAVRPAHTMLDGDTIFALATGQKKADVSTVGTYAAEALAQAIVRAVQAARPAGGLPAADTPIPKWKPAAPAPACSPCLAQVRYVASRLLGTCWPHRPAPASSAPASPKLRRRLAGLLLGETRRLKSMRSSKVLPEPIAVTVKVTAVSGKTGHSHISLVVR